MRIMHIFRAPVGGLFRHVRDLARAQAKAGHEVGIICDSTTGGETAALALAELSPMMALGITRLSMPRLPGPADMEALSQTRDILREKAPDIAHGHGAKGGLHARLAARGLKTRAIYTPHGGSLHYRWTSPAGAAFLAAERWLLRHTDGLIFVCAFERDAFISRVGRPDAPFEVVHNGLPPEEFVPVPMAPEAADFLFVGELRMLKGVDVLISALALLVAEGRSARAVIVGDGPDRAQFTNLLARHGLREVVSMPGAMPARAAFSLGRVMVVPSRAESFPYVVLEAQAAERPVIASDVGGIGEMLPTEYLVPPDDPRALAAAMARVMDNLEEEERAARERARRLAERFSAEEMARRITAFHEAVLRGGERR